MKMLVVIIVLAFAAATQAKEALIEGGRSKDRRYEVRIISDENRDPSNYVFAIYNAHAKKCILRVEDVSGIDRYDDARQSSKAFWNDTNNFVVFTDSGTRHNQEIYLFYVSDDTAMRVTFPDYIQNALGRVGALETDLHCRSDPARWEGNRLHIFLRFAVSDATHGRIFYTCEVVLECQDHNTSANIISITKPELEGDQ